MMGMVALLRMPTVWDKGSIVKTRASSLLLIVDHATLLDLLVSWAALGVPWILYLLLKMMLLLGLKVLTSFWYLLPFWPLFIGHRILPIQISLAFPYFELLLMFEV